MKRYSIVVVIIALATAACAPVYVPNARNAPLFRGAGEFQGSVNFSQGIDAQGAVSVTDHVGLMANYNYTNRTSSEDNDNYLKHRFFEGGIGYYANTGNLCYEIFGGYGKGEGTNYDNYDILNPSNVIQATGTYQRFFIQPALGSNHRVFNWAFAARFSVVDFDSFEKDGTVYPQSTGDPFLFIEPTFIGKVNFGATPIFMQFQAGFNYSTQGKPYFDYQPINLSLGFGVRFGGLKKEE